MNHDEFFKSLRAGTIYGLYLFEGEEEYVKRSALEQLEKSLPLGAFAEMNRTVLKDPDANTLIAAAETLPFMGERRIVVVRDSGMLAGKPKDYDEADSAERLKEYLPQMAPSTTVVFYVRGQADKRRKLYQILKKSAVMVAFDRLDQKQLKDYIARTLKKAGFMIQNDACDRLIYAAGDDLTTVLSEAEKLIAYCDGRKSITPEDISAVCTIRTEYRVFELAQTVLAGKGKQAFDMLRALITDGESPLMLLALLTRQCRQAYDARLYADQRVQQATIASKLGIPPFAVRQLIPLAQRYTAEELARMVRDCTEIEFRVKSGLQSEESAMDQAVMRILAIGRDEA